MTDLIRIILKPKSTVEKLLQEQSMSRSWQATWMIIISYAIFSLLYFLVGRDKLLAPLDENLGISTTNSSVWWVVGFWIVTVLYLIVDTILSRFGWEWFVRMGLRMAGGQKYASLSSEEKRERGRLMQLIQPYTYSVVVLVSAVGSIISLLTMQTASTISSVANGTTVLSQIMLQLLGSSFSALLSLGAIALMIVQRVFAIQRVYGVSGARAFWGPFIPYAISFFLLLVIIIVVIVAVIALTISALDGAGVTTF